MVMLMFSKIIHCFPFTQRIKKKWVSAYSLYFGKLEAATSNLIETPAFRDNQYIVASFDHAPTCMHILTTCSVNSALTKHVYFFRFSEIRVNQISEWMEKQEEVCVL